MERVLKFLRDLDLNNNKAWFESRRSEWEYVRGKIYSLCEGLINGISAFDPDVNGLEVKDCTYRIYRDIRFSNDKSPYKSWQGIFIAPHGKKAGYAGYYFHISGKVSEPHMLYAGLHCPEPCVLRSVREEMMLNGETMRSNIRKAESAGFVLYDKEALKRVPKGFPADSPYGDLLRLKEVGLEMNPGDSFMTDENLLENALRAFRAASGFVRQLNMAVEYAHEEMMG